MNPDDSSTNENPDAGILLKVLSLDDQGHRLDEDASPDNHDSASDTEPLITVNFDVMPEMLLIPAGNLSRFFHQTGRTLFPLLYLLFSVVYLGVVYTCGLAFAPSFDPNWMLKLPYTNNTIPDGNVKLHTLRELSVWLTLAWSVLGPVLLLCITSICHDQVVILTEKKMADLAKLSMDISNAPVELVQLINRSDCEKWLNKMATLNYLSFWLMYCALVFSVLAGGFIRSHLHHVFYLLYLLSMCIFSACEKSVSDVMLRLNLQKKFKFFSFSVYLLIYCFGVYLFNLLFIYPIVTPVINSIEDLLAYVKSLSTIAINGLVFYIYQQMINST